MTCNKLVFLNSSVEMSSSGDEHRDSSCSRLHDCHPFSSVVRAIQSANKSADDNQKNFCQEER